MGHRPPMVWCCQATSWTLIIAWKNIILSTIGLLFGTFAFTKFPTFKQEGTYMTLMACLGLVLIMGILLLIGSLKESPKLLSAWTLLSGFSLILAFAISSLQLIDDPASAIRNMMCICIWFFEIWVVHHVKNEIDKENDLDELLMDVIG